MFRTIVRKFFPNPFDWMLKRTARKGGKRILLGWNRGLGDIALGLYAMVERIREFIPDAEITFVTRENLRDGFSMLEGVKTIVIPEWKRGQPLKIREVVDPKQFDLIIEKPSPTDWVPWQRGKVIPKLKWNKNHDALYEKFGLSGSYIGAQVVAETNYGLWRNWPLERWTQLFDRLGHQKILLFGFGDEPKFTHKNVVDLRGKTTLFELLSIIKNCCHALILPDSGIASMAYYLDASFPLKLITLWADPNHGILKQQVSSPNPQLIHCPLIGERRDLSTITADQVIKQLFPAKPLQSCMAASEIEPKPVANTLCIILAGGQGSRLGLQGPKGLFPIHQKTLFQWICERSAQLPLAVMTSPLNHDETVAYFEKHHYFGREIHFFQQEMSPFLDENRRSLKIQGPNGNGSVFRSFVKSGLADLFAKRGIDLISVSYVDNPLADPFDPALITYARSEKADVVIQCIERSERYPSMGALVERAGKIEVVEYTELDPAETYKYAYSGQLIFDFSFFCKMADISLPLHWVRKRSDPIWIWKGEQFIFDVLPYASRARAVVAPRESCYAPLKGPESIEVVQQILRTR